MRICGADAAPPSGAVKAWRGLGWEAPRVSAGKLCRGLRSCLVVWPSLVPAWGSKFWDFYRAAARGWSTKRASRSELASFDAPLDHLLRRALGAMSTGLSHERLGLALGPPSVSSVASSCAAFAADRQTPC